MGSPLVEEALLALARRDKEIQVCLGICLCKSFSNLKCNVLLLVTPAWRHNKVRYVFTLDGDLGIGGGPPGLRV